jgi:hypothetical protein
MGSCYREQTRCIDKLEGVARDMGLSVEAANESDSRSRAWPSSPEYWVSAVAVAPACLGHR